MPSASPYERDGGGDAKTDMRSKYHADESLRSDKEIVMAAVTQNGYALLYADASLKADKEVVMAAVTQNGYALYQVPC